MRDVTSPSNLFRRVLCPGSHNAEAEYAEKGGNDASDEGVLLHVFAVDRRLKRDHLTPKQQQLLRQADIGHDQFLAIAAEKFGYPSVQEPPMWHNQRLPIFGPDREQLMTGETDNTYGYLPDGVAIIDHKMGFLEVTKADSNYQLAAYGIAWCDFLSADSALVAINQPRVTDKLTVAHYEFPQLEAARREIAAIMHAAEDPNAPRIAGDVQCKYCRAWVDCEEYRKRYRALETAPEKKTIAKIDTPRLKELASAVRLASSIKEEVMAEIAKRIESGEIDDWYMKDNGETKDVTDTVKAYQALAEYFAGDERFNGGVFSQCLSMEWGKTVKLFATLTGMKEGRARKVLEEILEPVIERKPKRSSPTPKA